MRVTDKFIILKSVNQVIDIYSLMLYPLVNDIIIPKQGVSLSNISKETFWDKLSPLDKDLVESVIENKETELTRIKELLGK